METTIRKPRKRKVEEPISATEVPEPIVAVGKEDGLGKPARKRKATTAKSKIVFVMPPVAAEIPAKAVRKRKMKKAEALPESEFILTPTASKRVVPAKAQREATGATADKDLNAVAAPAPAKKVAKVSRKKKISNPFTEVETTPIEAPKPVKKKKATQASWDKWVKATVVAVSPDVWNIHASELSHNSQFLTDLRKLPMRVLLDTPTLDYLFRCPDRLSHNARLVLNEEGVECLVSFESLREWADKVRAGHYLINKENGFFDKILDRFDVQSTATTTELYQKYISLKANAFVDISWERKPEDIVSTRLNADERPTRIIAAQALVLDVPILSPDLRYDAYKKDGLKTVW